MQARALVITGSCRAAETGISDGMDSGLTRRATGANTRHMNAAAAKELAVCSFPAKVVRSFAASLLTAGRDAFQTTDTVPI